MRWPAFAAAPGWLLACGAAVFALEPNVAIDEAIQNITSVTRPGRVGYATVWDGNKYVQCRRLPDRTLRCEAAGTVMQPSLGAVLTPDRISMLMRLGWTLDPSFGNFARVLPADMPSPMVADQILDVLRQVYDVAPSELEIETEWVSDVPCPPRNGPSQNLAGMVNDAPSLRASSVRACSYRPQVPPSRAGTREDLVIRYGGLVAAELQRLRINAKRNVYAVFDAGIGYIQCAPKSPTRVLYCEAQSAESWPALGAVLTSERVARLRSVGFAAPGRSPNYWRDYTSEEMTNTALAAELLSLLHDVYGYTGAPTLIVRTESR